MQKGYNAKENAEENKKFNLNEKNSPGAKHNLNLTQIKNTTIRITSKSEKKEKFVSENQKTNKTAIKKISTGGSDSRKNITLSKKDSSGHSNTSKRINKPNKHHQIVPLEKNMTTTKKLSNQKTGKNKNQEINTSLRLNVNYTKQEFKINATLINKNSSSSLMFDDSEKISLLNETTRNAYNIINALF